MKKINKELVGLLLFAALFYVLFWDQFWGLNILLLSVVSGALIFWFNPFAAVQRSVQLMFTANLLCAVGIFWQSSAFTEVIYVLSFILLIGKAQFPILTQLYFLCLAGLVNYFICLFNAFKLISNKLAFIPGYKKYHRWIIILILPIIITSVFLILYANANEMFNKLTFQFFDWIYKNLKIVFDLISLPKFFFLLFGFGIGASFIMRFKHKLTDTIETKLPDEIQSNSGISLLGTTTETGQRNYYSTAVISFAMVNILLLFVNILDIIHVWFNFEPSGAPELRQFVHAGTFILIFSVFVAIGMVLFFFYGNINFYKNNLWVKTLAYIWIGQNMIMVVSVLIRNIYYVQSFGLAFLRLGVFFFLIATLLALIFLIVKVNLRKSVSYYLRSISLVAYCVLLFIALYNWDTAIASYNLNYNRNNLDTKFILNDLSDKTLPIIWKNKDAFGNTNSKDYQHMLRRILKYQKRLQSDTWQSKTIKGMSDKQFFLNNNIPLPEVEKK